MPISMWYWALSEFYLMDQLLNVLTLPQLGPRWATHSREAPFALFGRTSLSEHSNERVQLIFLRRLVKYGEMGTAVDALA